jgi:hypothetical protein
MPFLRALPLLVLALVLAACGGNGGGSSATVTLTTTEPTPPAAAPASSTEAQPPTSTNESDVPTTDAPGTASSAPTDSTAADPAEQAVAEQAVLRAADIGAGWTGAIDQSEDSGCLTTPLREPGPTAELRGEELVKGQAQAVRSLALVYPDPETAAQAFTLASDFAAIDCFVQRLKERGGKGVQVDAVTAEPIQWPAAGDDVIAARVTVPVEQGLEGLIVTADIVMTRAGRVIIAAQFVSAPEPFPKAKAAEIVRAAANRVTTG